MSWNGVNVTKEKNKWKIETHPRTYYVEQAGRFVRRVDRISWIGSRWENIRRWGVFWFGWIDRGARVVQFREGSGSKGGEFVFSLIKRVKELN